MRVIYQHPDYCHEERRYVVGWLIEEVFGWDLSCQVTGRNDQQFMVEGEKGVLALPDTFFALAKENWLGKETLPEIPLPQSRGHGPKGTRRTPSGTPGAAQTHRRKC